MDILQLQYFKTVAELENISRAAESLFVAQPNLSISMKKLEEDIGVSLFDRRKGKIKLTPTGKIFLKYVDSILGELKEGVETVRQLEKKQPIHIKAATNMMDLITDLLPEMLALYPDISLSLVHTNYANIEKVLLGNVADVAFVIGKPTSVALEYIEFASCKRVAMLSESHPLADRDEISLFELTDYRIVSNISRGDNELYNYLKKTLNFDPNIYFECDEFYTELSMIAYGNGIAITPIKNYFKIKDQFPQYKVKCLTIKETVPNCSVGLARPVKTLLSDATYKFSEIITDFFEREDEKADKYSDLLR